MIFPLRRNPITRTLGLLLALTFACAFAPKSACALQIEGVEIPPQVKVGGTTLHLNGAGMRTLSPMGIPINLYVASFYSPTPIRSEKAALAAVAPLQLQFCSPDWVRGRTTSFYMLTMQGATAIGSMTFGWIAQLTTIRESIMLCAVVSLLGILLIRRFPLTNKDSAE